MDYKTLPIPEFNSLLSSKTATPGGGGASALVGALGASLVQMVGNLTVGKAKYAAFEPEIIEIMSEAKTLGEELLRLIDEDAAAFEPLANAYSIPKDRPERAEIMEKCLMGAAAVPMEILRKVCRVIELHEVLCEKGSILAVSDVGTGVVFAWAAMYGAAMNVRVNTHLMTNLEEKTRINAEVDELMQKYWPIAEKTYEKVWEKLG